MRTKKMLSTIPVTKSAYKSTTVACVGIGVLIMTLSSTPTTSGHTPFIAMSLCDSAFAAIVSHLAAKATMSSKADISIISISPVWPLVGLHLHPLKLLGCLPPEVQTTCPNPLPPPWLMHWQPFLPLLNRQFVRVMLSEGLNGESNHHRKRELHELIGTIE